jgi:hypothetical protein
MQRTLLASKAGQVAVAVPPTLLRSAFGDAWQQAGFKVQLSVHKHGACMAGRQVAAKQWSCSADKSQRRKRNSVLPDSDVSFPCIYVCCLCLMCEAHAHQRAHSPLHLSHPTACIRSDNCRLRPCDQQVAVDMMYRRGDMHRVLSHLWAAGGTCTRNTATLDCKSVALSRQHQGGRVSLSRTCSLAASWWRSGQQHPTCSR